MHIYSLNAIGGGGDGGGGGSSGACAAAAAAAAAVVFWLFSFFLLSSFLLLFVSACLTQAKLLQSSHTVHFNSLLKLTNVKTCKKNVNDIPVCHTHNKKQTYWIE